MKKCKWTPTWKDKEDPRTRLFIQCHERERLIHPFRISGYPFESREFSPLIPGKPGPEYLRFLPITLFLFLYYNWSLYYFFLYFSNCWIRFSGKVGRDWGKLVQVEGKVERIRELGPREEMNWFRISEKSNKVWPILINRQAPFLFPSPTKGFSS